jgi:hypothetical protein
LLPKANVCRWPPADGTFSLAVDRIQFNACLSSWNSMPESRIEHKILRLELWNLLVSKGAVPFQFKVPICDLLSFNIGWHVLEWL